MAIAHRVLKAPRSHRAAHLQTMLPAIHSPLLSRYPHLPGVGSQRRIEVIFINSTSTQDTSTTVSGVASLHPTHPSNTNPFGNLSSRIPSQLTKQFLLLSNAYFAHGLVSTNHYDQRRTSSERSVEQFTRVQLPPKH